jgi:hypothetical protein
MNKRVNKRSVRGVIISDARYSMAVHNGARAHTIRPRNKKALWWEGLDHPVGQVNHPGVRARPWLAQALVDECRPLGFRIVGLYGGVG